MDAVDHEHVLGVAQVMNFLEAPAERLDPGVDVDAERILQVGQERGSCRRIDVSIVKVTLRRRQQLGMSNVVVDHSNSRIVRTSSPEQELSNERLFEHPTQMPSS